jgi:hypothetical protein
MLFLRNCFYHCLMRKFFSDKAGATFNFEMPTFTYAVYRELYHTPPFPAWKTGLEEIWN